MSALDTVNSTGADLGNAMGVYGGLRRGTVPGYLGAGANAGSLVGRLSGDGALSQYSGDLGSLAGIVQGLQSGGWRGDTQAAVGAARLGSQMGAFPSALGQYAGYAAVPLALYNFVQNYQSGATGSDAINGAETGATIGSVIPAVGTLVGGLVGGAVGALSSAFGPGEEDPENFNWNNYASAYDQNPNIQNYITPAEAYQNLAGVMDAKDNSAGHSQPLERVFGQRGEQNLMDQLTGYLNSQYQSGAITPNESVADQWTKTIDPWLQSKGAGINLNQNTETGVNEGNALQGDLQSLVGNWESGFLSPYSQVGIEGQTIGGLTPYAGESPVAAQRVAEQKQMQDATRIDNQQRNYFPVAHVASGGSMSKNSNVDDLIYGRPFHERPREFDSGGYVSYYNSDPSQIDYSLSGSGSGASDPYSQLDYTGNGNPYSGLSTLDYSFSPSNPYSSGTGFDAYASSDPGFSPTGSPDTTSQGSDSGSWLKSILGAGSGVGQDLAQLAKSYGWLVPLIGAATGATNSKPAQPIAPPNGMSSGPSRPYSAPVNQRQPVKFNPDTDWYTYGEHPEQSFFTNNQLPYQPGLSPEPTSQPSGSPGGVAGGVLPSGMPITQLMTRPTTGPSSGGTINYNQMPVMAAGGALDFAEGSGQHYVAGPGDGTSDDIPARLSDGEYVMDAGTVSMLGNGSNEAGARRLDMLRENLRKHAGRQLVRGKQFMKAKPPEQYLPRSGTQPRKGQE